MKIIVVYDGGSSAGLRVCVVCLCRLGSRPDLISDRWPPQRLEARRSRPGLDAAWVICRVGRGTGHRAVRLKWDFH